MFWILIAMEIYLLIAQLFLAGKDASSYLLFTRSPGPWTKTRTARWHRDGAALALLFLMACITISLLAGLPTWCVGGAGILLRLSIYDWAFAYYASLPVNKFGTTARSDKLFARVFGQNGAIIKAVVFTAVLLAFNICIIHFEWYR